MSIRCYLKVVVDSLSKAGTTRIITTCPSKRGVQLVVSSKNDWGMTRTKSSCFLGSHLFVMHFIVSPWYHWFLKLYLLSRSSRNFYERFDCIPTLSHTINNANITKFPRIFLQNVLSLLLTHCIGYPATVLATWLQVLPVILFWYKSRSLPGREAIPVMASAVGGYSYFS